MLIVRIHWCVCLLLNCLVGNFSQCFLTCLLRLRIKSLLEMGEGYCVTKIKNQNVKLLIVTTIPGEKRIGYYLRGRKRNRRLTISQKGRGPRSKRS